MEGERNSMAQPQSAAAQNFAADLDSMFGLSHGIATLSQTVEEKKASVSSGQSELEQLEARLRETEQRLAKVSRQSSPARQADGGADEESRNAKQSSPLSQRPTYPDDRPPTGRQAQPRRNEVDERMQGMPGGMPASQGQMNAREDYVMVESRTS